ncbi:MAG: nitrilase-related carbon-nitrogen hydrolase, partial [Rhodoferax sp.]
LICYDVEFPEATRRLALAGADLIVVPTANMPEFDFVAQSLVPVRAYENQLYVAYANYIGAEGAVHYGGLSLLAAPDGQ